MGQLKRRMKAGKLPGRPSTGRGNVWTPDRPYQFPVVRLSRLKDVSPKILASVASTLVKRST